MEGKLNHTLLAKYFPVPSAKKKRKVNPTYADSKGRIAYLEKAGQEWEGWFPDEKGPVTATYIASTKRQLMVDMGVTRVTKS